MSQTIPLERLSITLLCEAVRASFVDSTDADPLIAIIKEQTITGKLLANLSDEELRSLGIMSFGQRRILLELAAQKSVVISCGPPEVLTLGEDTSRELDEVCMLL